MINEKAIRREIIEVCQRLYQRNMLAAADGNVSYRLDDQRILITPSGVSKAFMSPDEMAIMKTSAEIVSGNPSSERLMHLEVYQQCPKAKCVVHAHPPTAIAWSIARPHLKELPADCMSELILAVRGIPFVPYARPGTEDMGKNLREFLPKSRVLILSRHGALAWGESLQEALNGMERLEHAAQVLLYAEQLGGLTHLPPHETEVLYAMRDRTGEKIL